jgi:hypothetical protein
MYLTPWCETTEYLLRWWATMVIGRECTGPFGGQMSMALGWYSPDSLQMLSYFCITVYVLSP